jgi:aldehyde dehydrogenase (NAD+)
LRAGNVHINGAGLDINAPFGGYKQSGNGREFSTWGLEEFLETKSMLGFEPPKMNAEEGSGFIDF